MSTNMRRVVVPAMDIGHEKFSVFLAQRFNSLRDELIKECDRIAIARELSLKKELEKARLHNQQLRSTLSKDSQSSGCSTVKSEIPQGPSPLGSSDVEATTREGISKLSSVPSKSLILLADNLSESGGGSTKVALDSAQSSGRNDSPQFVPDDSKLKRPHVISLDNALVDPPQLVPISSSISASTLDSACASVNTTPEQPGKHHGFHTHREHFTLWPEWTDHASEVLRSVSKAELEEHETMEDSQLEVEWLQHRAPVKTQEFVGDSASCCTSAPNSTFAFLWEMISMPILAYDLVTIPMQVFYQSEGTLAKLLAWGIICYWTVDMLLRLLVLGFSTHRGEVELERIAIMRHYLRTSFAFDFIMVAPDWLSMFIGAPRNVAVLRVFRLMRLLRLMRMSKLKKIQRRIQDVLDSEYFSVLVNISINIVTILGCCHYVACFWFFLGCEKIDGYPSWVEVSEIEDAKWQFQYVTSLHWAIAQFTPASSKVQPQNLPETLVAITVLVFGMVFFSLFISSLTQERMRLQALTSKMDRDNWILRRYLRQHGVSGDLTVRTIRYVDACVAPLMQRVQRKDVALLEYLSRPLQLEVQAEMFSRTLLVHPFMHNLRERSMSLTSHLFANVVIEVSLAHTDMLFEVGQVAHEMYFISHGTLAYVLRGANEITCIRTESWCCEPVLWLPWVNKGTTRAAEECHLISIDTAKMRTCVLEHKERSFVRKCALGYLKDINAYVDQGLPISDTLRITDDPSSEYMKAMDNSQNGTASESVPIAARIDEEK